MNDPASMPGRRTRSRLTFESPVVLTMADGSTREATTHDISLAGLSVVTERPIAPGSRCTVVLALSQAGHDTDLTLAAKAVYSSYTAPRQFRIGLVFTQIDPQGQERLRVLVG